MGATLMKNVTTERGRLRILRRFKNSLNGNPRYAVAIHPDGADFEWHAKTIPDSGEAYALTNFVGKLVDCELGVLRGHTHIQNIREVSA